MMHRSLPVATTYATPPTDATRETLILYNSARFNQVYPTGDTFASANLLSKINLLAADSSVHGVPIDLDTTATITGGLLLRDAYTLWNSTPANQQNPQYANYVARSIKALLYKLAPHSWRTAGSAGWQACYSRAYTRRAAAARP